jgi:hypothetical protein
MPIVLNGTTGITTPTYNGNTTAEYLVPVTAFKNRIINGAMVIDQRNNGASVTPSSGSSYTLDRWKNYNSQASKLSFQQNAGSVTPPAGFTNYLGATSLSAYSVGSSDEFDLYQLIEGYNMADLGWGTANAKSVTLSFWVRSSLTGTFGGTVANSGNSRNYPFSYTISASNTWEYKTVTIAGDTSGTWLTTNGVGISLLFSLGAGSSLLGTAGAWTGTASVGATGQVNLVGTNGATLYITGVQIEVGSTATSFDYRPYTTELQLCQRYYAKLGANPASIGNPGYQAHGAGCNQAVNTSQNIYLGFPQFMRTSPSIGYSGNIGITALGSYVTLSSISGAYTGVNSSLVQTTTPAVGSAGDGATLISNGDTSAFISLTAEL